jgi:hypothetical protein
MAQIYRAYTVKGGDSAKVPCRAKQDRNDWMWLRATKCGWCGACMTTRLLACCSTTCIIEVFMNTFATHGRLQACNRQSAIGKLSSSSR